MHRVILGCWVVGMVLTGVAQAGDTVRAPKGQVKKVLPHLLDAEGRHTVSPSLFDRDAYQAHLRANPQEVTGVRYDICWKVSHAEGRPVTLRVELRGLYEGREPHEVTLETSVDDGSTKRRWTQLTLAGEEFARFGTVTAWRASLWCDGKLLDEYRSFLW